MTLFTNTEAVFEEARKIYPGIKRGHSTEFQNFKKHKDFESVVTDLKQAIINQIRHREVKRKRNEFVPEWQHFKTWINQRSWELEIPSYETELKKLGAEELHHKIKAVEKNEPKWDPSEDSEWRKAINQLKHKWELK